MVPAVVLYGVTLDTARQGCSIARAANGTVLSVLCSATDGLHATDTSSPRVESDSSVVSWGEQSTDNGE